MNWNKMGSKIGGSGWVESDRLGWVRMYGSDLEGLGGLQLDGARSDGAGSDGHSIKWIGIKLIGIRWEYGQ